MSLSLALFISTCLRVWRSLAVARWGIMRAGWVCFVARRGLIASSVDIGYTCCGSLGIGIGSVCGVGVGVVVIAMCDVMRQGWLRAGSVEAGDLDRRKNERLAASEKNLHDVIVFKSARPHHHHQNHQSSHLPYHTPLRYNLLYGT